MTEIRSLLEGRPELRPLLARLPAAGPADEPHALQRLYHHVMTMPQREVDAMLDPLATRLAEQFDPACVPSSESADSPDFWAVRAAREFALPGGARDRGIVSIYLLNLLRLAPGQATFIGPGVLHAYLSGVAVEIMASSDNVLRGGLTPKHVDVRELLRILRFEPLAPRVVAGDLVSDVEREYRGPAAEFTLARWELRPGQALVRRSVSAEVLLVLEGGAVLEGAGERLSLRRGQLALVPAGLDYALGADTAGVIAFRAAVPL